jgi:hypothetical protein
MAITIPPRELPVAGVTHQDGPAAALQAFGIAAVSIDPVGLEGANTT